MGLPFSGDLMAEEEEEELSLDPAGWNVANGGGKEAMQCPPPPVGKRLSLEIQGEAKNYDSVSQPMKDEFLQGLDEYGMEQPMREQLSVTQEGQSTGQEVEGPSETQSTYERYVVCLLQHISPCLFTGRECVSVRVSECVSVVPLLSVPCLSVGILSLWVLGSLL